LEYFKVLNEVAHINPILPGSHPNLYAVELPSCTPTRIVQAMVERFRHDLCNALDILAAPATGPPPPHNLRARIRRMSHSNISTSSSQHSPSFDHDSKFVGVDGMTKVVGKRDSLS